MKIAKQILIIVLGLALVAAVPLSKGRPATFSGVQTAPWLRNFGFTYPLYPNDQVLIGATATATLASLEVHGSVALSGAFFDSVNWSGNNGNSLYSTGSGVFWASSTISVASFQPAPSTKFYGWVFDEYFLPGMGDLAATNGTFVASSTYFTPFVFPRSGTIAFAVNVAAGSAGTNVHCALYGPASATDPRPLNMIGSEVILPTPSSGAMAMQPNSTTTYAVTVNTLYHVTAYSTSSAVTFRTVPIGSIYPLWGLPLVSGTAFNLVLSTTTGNGTTYPIYTLPATFDTTNAVLTTTVAPTCGYIWVN